MTMIESRLPQRRCGAPPAVILPVALAVVLALALPLLATAVADPAAAGEPTSTRLDDSLSSTEVSAGCQPPSTHQWVLIVAGTVVLAVLSFFLLVRVTQGYFIHRDWNSTLGRHSGISLTLLFSSLGMLALAYLITGCLHRRFLVWLLFPLALWAIHGLHTLVVVRNE